MTAKAAGEVYVVVQILHDEVGVLCHKGTCKAPSILGLAEDGGIDLRLHGLLAPR